MFNPGAKEFIKSLQKQWMASIILSGLCLWIAALVLISSVILLFANIPVGWLILLGLISTAGFAVFYLSRKVNETEISRFLNQTYPELEESSQLVLRPQESLNFLERLQKQKIEQILPGLPKPNFNRRIKSSAGILVLALAASFLISIIPFQALNLFPQQENLKTGNGKTQAKEVLLPEIKSLQISLQPPAYTRKKSRKQQQFSILAEEGSELSWLIQTTKPVKNLSFIFNDHEKLELKPLNNEQTRWQISKRIHQPGFYQVSIDGRLSDLYKLEIIPDQPPAIKVLNPKPYSTIDFGHPQKVNLQLSIADDYGIKDAHIWATIASGKGEGVKFKEQKIAFASSFAGQLPQYALQKTIDLKALGMIPGDELYFYIRALDTRNQESRSDVFVVSIQDTTQLMSLEGMASGVNLVPEYFRSQRQIIIDTEKLLKEKDTTSVESFKTRSNNLGIDQKLLRLRYGKFLGEEFESGTEHHDEDEHEHAGEQNNMDKILEAYGHKHDNAEDATFFEPELKAQLKATLTEMWNSELRLRTYKPAEALPYEYKALRLLKDLQQKSRAYVAKTAFNPPPLKPEKRLSGELDQIINPLAQRQSAHKANQVEVLKKAAAILQKLKTGGQISPAEQEILQQTNQQLSNAAASRPGDYLNALIAMRKIMESKPQQIKAQDIATVETALQKMIPADIKLPQAATAPGPGLWQQYFKNLNQRK
ncbi:MAG TPA: DUF4175 family protein [Daejeonella sp.]|nr:DUF4175 family protein [Daejeonella sp.]